MYLIACLLIYWYTREWSMVSVTTLIFSYLRKAFDCMSLYLLIYKIEVYGFSKNSNIFVPSQGVWLDASFFYWYTRQKSMVSIRPLIFSHLRKVLYCMPLELLIHQTMVYGFSKNSNIFVCSQGVWLHISLVTDTQDRSL